MRKTVVWAGGPVVAAMLVIFMGCSGDATKAGPLASPSGTPSTDQREVLTTFPTEQHQLFEAPPELQSTNGLLETTFDVHPTTFNVAGAKVRGYAYQGQFMGPTLRVLPGDVVRIHLRNRLKEPTNLHSHGMYVSPIGISDNVLRVMKAAATTNSCCICPAMLSRARTGTTPIFTATSRNRCSPGSLGCSSSTG
jgi:FtsP/CotA-like multicopper oxidase with cupredoxin domain